MDVTRNPKLRMFPLLLTVLSKEYDRRHCNPY